MIEASQLVSRLNALPTLPEAVSRLAALVSDENAIAADFEQVIRPDPALTANVLRAANSVFYRGVSEISSVRDAVARMGIRRVFEVATSTSFCRTLPPKIPGYEMPVGEFWRHCVGVAVVAERLARELRLMNADIAFTAGLLHDVGKLVIGTCLIDVVASSWRHADLDSAEAELRALGVDHADVGEEIAMRWRLPAAVKDAARWHHRPEQVPADSDRDSAELVYVADVAYYAFGLRADKAKAERAIGEGSLYRLHLTLEQVGRVAEESRSEIDKMTEVTATAARA